MTPEKESTKDIKSDGDEELASESASPAAAVLTFDKTTPKVSFEFIDHFSLNKPSSTIRSRGVTTRIYDVDNNQLQLEQHTEIVNTKENGYDDKKDPDDKKSSSIKVVTKMKRIGGNNPGLIFLRLCYTLVALLMAGFTFVFISNVIVMQTMEIPRNFGQAAGTELNVPVLIANILSLPLLVYSMSSLMIFCLVFVRDVWAGHVMFRLLLPTVVPQVFFEWYSFIMYLFLPLLIMCIASFAGANNTNEIAGMAWWLLMLISFLIFCAMVFYNEVKLCMDIARCFSPDLNNLQLLKQTVLATLTQRFCGTNEKYFLVKKGGSELTASTLTENQPIRTHQSLNSRFKSLSCNPFFVPVNPPIRQYSIQELQEAVPIVTKQTWSLDRACCGLRKGRAEFAVDGEDAIDPHQSKSGLICSIVGVVLGCLVAVAYLNSAGVVTSAGAIAGLYFLILVLIGLPCVLSAYRVYQATTLPLTEEEDGNEEPAFQSWTQYRVVQPKEWYCWLRLVVASVFFFLWPAISLFTNNLPKSGVIFLFTSIFSAVRLNLDAGSILKQHSSKLDAKFCDDTSSQQQLIARARASQVLAKATNSSLYFIALIGFGFMAGYFIYFAGTSAGSGEDYTTQTGREPIRLIDDFYYPPQNKTMLYPTCKLSNQFQLPGFGNTYALDYNFLAGIAYETTEVSTYLMERWFGSPNVVVDEEDFVSQWREDSGNADEQVSFKLFSFPVSPGIGILSIRGTETPMDRLGNAQLYIGSVLTQLVRGLMPFSWLWDDSYDDLLLTTSWVASDHLQQSDYYRITTEFVNDLLLNDYSPSPNGKRFDWLRTTGVSLGGGLALITGAQTDAYAFAFSGPNPTLARKTWNPPISLNNLKERVINIKPENDFVSSIGDVVPNYQLVRCRDWPAREHNCHSFWRIFCEYMYTCGSPSDRAGAFCDCAQKWGYPEPIAKGNRTFEQACNEEQATMEDTLGDIFGELPWKDQPVTAP